MDKPLSCTKCLREGLDVNICDGNVRSKIVEWEVEACAMANLIKPREGAMGLSDDEVEALNEAEDNLALIERCEPCSYAECKRLYQDLLLTADDLEQDRDPGYLAAFEFCLERWRQRAQVCLNRQDFRPR